MDKYKQQETPIEIGKKLSKQYNEPIVDSTLYRRLVGNLMYHTTTILDVMYAVSFISIFMESPKDSHLKVGKTILRYIVGTIHEGLWNTTYEYNILIGYIDNEFFGNIDDR
jgi:hypothetical protein